jgi:hypothetical protein
MAKVKLKCPSCGSEVELGDIVCKTCGVNLKSGESFETRAKQVRGKAIHPEHFSARIYVGVVLAFGLAIFSGLMYQTQMVNKAFRERPDLYQYPVTRLQDIDDLIAMAQKELTEGKAQDAQEHYAAAAKLANELVAALTSADEGIKPEELYSVGVSSHYNYNREPPYNKRLAKRVLRDLKAKAEAERGRIPAQYLGQTA